MSEKVPILEQSSAAIKATLLAVQESVRRELSFVEQTPYYETVFKQAVNNNAKTPANCEAYAGMAAELLDQKGIKSYIANCSYHLFTIAVDYNGSVHMLHADHPGFSRFNLERSCSELQRPLFLSGDIIAQLQANVPLITGDSYPQDLGVYDRDDVARGFFTAPEWTKYRRKPVGLIAWPAGKDFLFTRSVIRSTLYELAAANTYQPAALEALSDNLQSFQAVDVDCDRSAKGSYSRLILGAIKTQSRLAPDRYALEKIYTITESLLPVNNLRPPYNTNGQKIIKGDALTFLVDAYVAANDFCTARGVALQAQALYLQAMNLDKPISHSLDVKLNRIQRKINDIETRA